MAHLTVLSNKKDNPDSDEILAKDSLEFYQRYLSVADNSTIVDLLTSTTPQIKIMPSKKLMCEICRGDDSTNCKCIEGISLLEDTALAAHEESNTFNSDSEPSDDESGSNEVVLPRSIISSDLSVEDNPGPISTRGLVSPARRAVKFILGGESNVQLPEKITIPSLPNIMDESVITGIVDSDENISSAEKVSESNPLEESSYCKTSVTEVQKLTYNDVGSLSVDADLKDCSTFDIIKTFETSKKDFLISEFPSLALVSAQIVLLSDRLDKFQLNTELQNTEILSTFNSTHDFVMSSNLLLKEVVSSNLALTNKVNEFESKIKQLLVSLSACSSSSNDQAKESTGQLYPEVSVLDVVPSNEESSAYQDDVVMHLVGLITSEQKTVITKRHVIAMLNHLHKSDGEFLRWLTSIKVPGEKLAPYLIGMRANPIQQDYIITWKSLLQGLGKFLAKSGKPPTKKTSTAKAQLVEKESPPNVFAKLIEVFDSNTPSTSKKENAVQSDSPKSFNWGNSEW